MQLAGTSFDAREGTVLNLIVTRSGGDRGSASVDYATADGTAEGGSDYTAVTGTLTWADGVSGNKTISIRIPDDDLSESLESFTVALSNASVARLGANSSAIIDIIDSDPAALSAFGAITDLSSATVNGIRYETNDTDIHINGQRASVSDLKLGQVVAVEGEVNFSNASGRADEIHYSAMVIGPVENIDATLKRLIVTGQTVLANDDTVFDASIDPDTFAGLTPGAIAQISGYREDSGNIVATRIESDATSTDVQVTGAVTGLDDGNMLFTVNRLTVDYSSAIHIDLPMGMPTEGLLVMVRGLLDNGILAAEEIASAVNPAAAPGARTHLGGIVTRFASPTDFDLNGFPITTRTDTGYVNGVVGDLRSNAEIIIEGEVNSAGDKVLAKEVIFGRPVYDRTTLTFDFNNFTNIAVFGLSSVTVLQGPDYSVEVTAGTGGIDDAQVVQTGDLVSFGMNNAQILDAVVTMPQLNRIDVGAGARANVIIEGFDQLQMTVNLGGVSVLRGEDLRIGDLTAIVSGVSLLDFDDIRPIGNAEVDISGVSQARLNMEVGSSLSGSVRTGMGTGVSMLYHYGTNTSVNVSTDRLSRVMRLGDTKP